MRAVSCLLAISLVVPVAVAEYDPSEDCDARVDATLSAREPATDSTLFRFDVEVSSETDCEVVYDLIVELLLPNGWTKKVRKTRRVSLDDGSSRDTVDVSLATDLKMLGHEATVARCERCSVSEVTGNP